MDLVIKIGGSLCKYPKELKELCQGLSRWLRSRKCILTPGGGPFADLIRQVQRDYALSDDVAHEMALLAVDQYGLMLSSIIDGSMPVRTIAEAKRLTPGIIPILLPSHVIMSLDLLEHSWSAGSDCIAAAIARACNANKLVLIKDVDGVYEPSMPSNILAEVSLSRIEQMKTCLDPFLPRVLKGSSIECIVVNGLKPERVKAVINGLKTICTRIITE
ncbi:MAG: amino acid kinase family protein [Candidatus Nezhaarchaeales archaeon]